MIVDYQDRKNRDTTLSRNTIDEPSVGKLHTKNVPDVIAGCLDVSRPVLSFLNTFLDLPVSGRLSPVISRVGRRIDSLVGITVRALL